MRFAILAQHLAPQKTLSRIVRAATRWTWRPWKNFLIGRVVQAYNVDMNDAAQPDPFAFLSFNDFFTRGLRIGARAPEGGAGTLVSPADGRISQIGRIEAGRILQAKGRGYSVGELFTDPVAAERYRDGAFATIYLSPSDYHRVHMPLDGELVESVHVPGRLFSVAPGPVADIPNLFARNERLICHFEGPRGPFVVAMVGAILVSGITTVWGGPVVPPYGRGIVHREWRGWGVRLERGAEMGRFEMGSTVIVLVPSARFDPALRPESVVRVGRRLGDLWTGPDQGTITGHGENGAAA